MFSSKVTEKLKYYVYLYADPRTNKPFYIGKGRGNRCFAHLKDKKFSEKVGTIQELKKLGIKPRIEILKYGLDEDQALLVEATAIDLLDVDTLMNQVRGHGTKFGGRDSVDEIAAQLGARPVDIKDPVILITINQKFHYGMSLQEIYDVTRSAWVVAPQKHQAEYALSIFRGIVREVFEIQTWIPGGTTMRGIDTDGYPEPRSKKRHEFVGRVAEDKIRRRYAGNSVRHYFKKGAQNPIMYLNC